MQFRIRTRGTAIKQSHSTQNLKVNSQLSTKIDKARQRHGSHRKREELKLPQIESANAYGASAAKEVQTVPVSRAVGRIKGSAS